MLRKVFWEDAYLATLETRVTAVMGDDVTVAATIFYTFSGGQESDAGKGKERIEITLDSA